MSSTNNDIVAIVVDVSAPTGHGEASHFDFKLEAYRGFSLVFSWFTPPKSFFMRIGPKEIFSSSRESVCV